MDKPNYKALLPNITTFIFDVDGVLTNGKVLITSQGEMYREMDTKDGYALKCALVQGYKVCIISGGTNEGVRNRLKALGIYDIYLGAHHKQEPFQDLMDSYDLKPEEILYMGDDVPDIVVMEQVAVAACPNDAVSDVKEIANYVSHKKGGEGCVREIIEQTLRVQGKWLTNIGAKND
ncbi:MAG: HAD-IIIA family hydrolase [Candidatus Arcticimaribacter sp.]|jgi:3-deoxy-D-manno-octulosonate 8-phosphate phosphatase (KDO 8-P phosphatase)